MMTTREAGRRARRIPFGSTIPEDVRMALALKVNRQAYRATMDAEQKQDRKRELQLEGGVLALEGGWPRPKSRRGGR